MIFIPKDAYYFSHDSNAKDDPKCVLLIEQLGLEGYGIFWMLIETLRDQPNYKYPVALIPALARRYNTTAEKTRTVVNSYGLFVVDENEFFSLSLMERMDKMGKLRQQRVEAGKKSAEKRLLLQGKSTSVERALNEIPTDVEQLKEKKVKESKVNEIINTYTTNGMLIDSINAFMEMRVKIKRPMTDRAIGMLFNELDKICSTDKEKIDALNRSTMNCWQSVYSSDKPKQQQRNVRSNEPEVFEC